jgi:hypothetical protein
MVAGMKHTIGIGVLLLAVLSAGSAVAGPKWKNLGDFTTGGGAKEIAVNREISEIAIDVKEGRVLINTLWVREGAKKTEITVAREMNKGDKTHFIKLDGKRNVTGFRVSDGAQGRYRISVK